MSGAGVCSLAVRWNSGSVSPDCYHPSVKKRQIEKLSAEIAELDRDRREDDGGVHELGLTVAEQRFVAASDARGKKLYRSGWPDFMCIDKDTGGVCFVEVKFNDDEVRPSQARMFAAMEEHLGVCVMVWDPALPDRLVPWRTYRDGRADRLDTGTSPRSHHRRRVASMRPRDGG